MKKGVREEVPRSRKPHHRRELAKIARYRKFMKQCKGENKKNRKCQVRWEMHGKNA